MEGMFELVGMPDGISDGVQLGLVVGCPDGKTDDDG